MVIKNPVWKAVFHTGFLLFKIYFKQTKMKMIVYYLRQVLYVVEVLVMLIIVNYINSFVMTGILILDLILKFIICITIPNILIVLLHAKTKEFIELRGYLIRLFKEIIRKDKLIHRSEQ